MTKLSTLSINLPIRESDKMFRKRIATAYIYKPIVMNNDEIIYCLADNDGRILSIEEVNELFLNIKTFYKDIPDVDEVICALNKKLFKGEE